MFDKVQVAAISFKPEKFDVKANADRLEAMFRTAAAAGAALAVAPEGVLEGYVIMEFIEGREVPERMREVALTMRGAVIRRFRNLARKLNMSLAFGCAERLGSDVYNCAVFIDEQGKIRGKYHKMQLAEGYHPSWWYNRLGQASRAFNTPFGRAGFLICNDRWNPDIARIPVLDGAQMILIPSFGSRSQQQDKAVLARARENGVPIVEANVGVRLIISKGEIVTVNRRLNGISYGTIEIPAAVGRANREVQEKTFLQWRKKEMKRRYLRQLEHSKKSGKKND